MDDAENKVSDLMEALQRSVRTAKAARRHRSGEEMFECPCCKGVGTVAHGDTCVCCQGACLVDEDRLVWWDEWRAVV